MQLTRFSDYALRALMFLATRPVDDPWSNATAIADAYDISAGHVAKTIQRLSAEGWVETRRGRDGGARHAIDPRQQTLGTVLRATEIGAPLVECFDPATNRCPVTSACGLKQALGRAESAFYAALDEVTLADIVLRPSAFVRLLLPRGDQSESRL
jgi:Rrf2 family transcriptional regulator, nitric oxide-sensitive transcriptional repressor